MTVYATLFPVAIGHSLMGFVLPKAPTILTNVVETDAIMQHDITGPVLPVLSVDGVDEAITFINRQEKPLCVYAYSSDGKVRSGQK